MTLPRPDHRRHPRPRPGPRPRARPTRAGSSSSPAATRGGSTPCAPRSLTPQSFPATSPTREHRQTLGAVVARTGRLDLLVNNASELGPSPLPRLADLPARRAPHGPRDQRRRAARADPAAAARSCARRGGTVLNISSDAAVEAYEGWGGYGSSKAALDHLSAVLAVEEPGVRVYAVDPGDLRTEMHQRAFPGEDISDRPLPAEVVPDLLRLLAARPASGRYRAAEWAAAEAAPMTVVDFDAARRAGGRPAARPPGRRPAARGPTRPASSTRRFADLADHLRARRPGRGQHLGHAAGRGRRHPRRRAPRSRSTSRPGWTTADWVVEVRPGGAARGPVDDLAAGRADRAAPGRRPRTIARAAPAGQHRLWRADVPVEGGRRRLPPTGSAGRSGTPTSRRRNRLAAYQTVFAREPGSAEMPSAARPFTDRLVTDLVTRGVDRRADPAAHRRLLAGCGRAAAARAVRRARGDGPAGQRDRAPGAGAWSRSAPRSPAPWSRRPAPTAWSAARSGWTDLVLGADRPARVVTGLVTGWHAPGASHLQLLQAVAGTRLVATAYAEALRERYLWHEFGDSALLLP